MRLAKKFYPKKRELRIWDEDRPTLETFPLDFSDGAFDWGELEEFTTKEEAQDWVDETIADVFGCEKLEVFGFIDIAKYGAVEIEAVGHDYKCDICGKKADYNVQSVYHRYRIEDNGNFEDEDEWEGEDNEFYCEKCFDNSNLK
jgi:hypothetical protein